MKPEFVSGLNSLDFLRETAPVHVVETGYGPIRFLMYGETTEFRVRTFFTKEPETLAWIDTFAPGDVFWDIGANIGLYSFYAASRQDLQVLAFEPSPANFYLLTANYERNMFQGNVELFPFALSDFSGIFRWCPSSSLGSANNQLLDGGRSIAIQAYSVDDLIATEACSAPNHLKIDVDGLEYLILKGAQKTLADSRLKSIMIEVDETNLRATKELQANLLGLGFSSLQTRHEPYKDKNHYLPFSNWLFRR